MALRSYALSGGTPSEVIGRLRVLMAALLPDEMATLVYAVLDPESSRLTFANAGHPPPLLLYPSGQTRYLSEPLGPPLVGSARAAVHDLDAEIDLPTSATLLLYTDGLVERRGEALTVGLARLRHWTEDLGADVEGLCDGLLGQLLTEERTSDDVALLAVRADSYLGNPFRARLPAEPRSLAPLRAAMRRWLRENVADREADYPVLLACGEASANAIQHAYGARGGSFEVGLRLVDDAIEATVRDDGTWREGVRPMGGRGLTLIRTYMDDVTVDAGPSGTMIRMRRRIDRPAAS
jgi:anti-sigma regulatory factor (Ser/Thr protein kinase)